MRIQTKEQNESLLLLQFSSHKHSKEKLGKVRVVSVLKTEKHKTNQNTYCFSLLFFSNSLEPQVCFLHNDQKSLGSEPDEMC